MVPAERTRAALADLKQMQIKTLSFLAFLMRQAHAIVRAHQVTPMSAHLRAAASCRAVVA